MIKFDPENKNSNNEKILLNYRETLSYLMKKSNRLQILIYFTDKFKE